MHDKPYNPDDLAFLISQGLDGDLSAQQRRRLDEALSASAELRREAEDFAAVDGLVGRWAERRVNLAWDATAGLIGAEVRGDQGDIGLQQVDALLDRWGRSQAAGATFDVSRTVLEEILAERSKGRSRHLVLRFGTPLAMAAAVALVVFGTTWFEPAAPPTLHVDIRSPISESVANAEPPRTVVSFARSDGDTVARESLPATVGFITLGAGPVVTSGEASSL